MFASIPYMDSLSSSLMLGVTVYRNQRGFKQKLLGQLGYVSITVFSIFETIIALPCYIGSIALYPVFPLFLKRSASWLKSSSFTILWSSTDLLLNLFVIKLVADEASARKIAQSCDLLTIPRGAVL